MTVASADYDEILHDFARPEPAYFNFGSDVVDAWARDPHRLALIAVDEGGRERRFTYRDVAVASNRAAALLTGLGVSRGDRVLVVLPRIPEWQIVMVACLKLGALPIPCVTMLTAHDIAYRVRHSQAKAVITTSEQTAKFDDLDVAARIAVGAAPQGWVGLDEADELPEQFTSAQVAASDPAIIYYTSGSTGMPKGVTHSSGALFAWRTSAEYWLSLGEGDVMWCTADTGWSKAGTSILFGPWSRGATVLFYDGPFDPQARLRLIARYGVGVFCAPATEFRQLIRADFTGIDLSRLRLAVSAGESVNPEVVERWRALTGALLLDGYGQTETLMTVVNYPFLPVKPGSMGRPLPGVQMGVRDADGVGDTGPRAGALVLRTPNPQLMLGYWNDRERTANCFEMHDGVTWFVTGDNVRIDEDGYYHFVGRDDDVINSSGYRIGPQEVENALIEHPAVLESAVVGVPDEQRGEVVKAFVILQPGVAPTPELVTQLQAHTKAHTAPYKYPRLIEFVATLPKTPTGKIQRAKLRQRNQDG